MEYKGFTLIKCFCGYPEKRWVIYWGHNLMGNALTKKNAKEKVNEIISSEKWYAEHTKAVKRVEKLLSC